MDYQESVDYLYSLKYLGIQPRIEHTRVLADKIGLKFDCPVIHVGGTNGKGSVCCMTERVLREHGLKTGLYVSPQLMDFNDRVFVNGIPIRPEEFARQTTEVRHYIDELESTIGPPSFFEATTCICLKYLMESDIDALVLEVGLGGRWDSTNVIDSNVSVITNVELEHTEYLGDTLSKIAGEKASFLA